MTRSRVSPERSRADDAGIFANLARQHRRPLRPPLVDTSAREHLALIATLLHNLCACILVLPSSLEAARREEAAGRPISKLFFLCCFT